jgi:hypothetical protein
VCHTINNGVPESHKGGGSVLVSGAGYVAALHHSVSAM